MTKASAYVKEIQAKIHEKDQHQPEFLQAIDEFLPTIVPFLEEHPEYIESNILALLTEPERFIQFRVPWQDDQGNWRSKPWLSDSIQLGNGALQRRLAFSPKCQLEYLEVFGV